MKNSFHCLENKLWRKVNASTMLSAFHLSGLYQSGFSRILHPSSTVACYLHVSSYYRWHRAKKRFIFFYAKSTHWEHVGAVQVKMLLITLYTKEHTKSMKPHCILGSCSAQFLSIMGWGRESERVSDEITILRWREDLRGERHLQLVVGPKHFSPSLLVPRILQPPSEPPEEGRIMKGLRETLGGKYCHLFHLVSVISTLGVYMCMEWTSFFSFPSRFNEYLQDLLLCFVLFFFHLLWASFYILQCDTTWRLWRPPTLLCTSQGLVIADKSQPVIIMALEVRDRQEREDDNLPLMLIICKGLLLLFSTHKNTF